MRVSAGCGIVRTDVRTTVLAGVVTPRPSDEWIAQWRGALRARFERHAAARTPVAAMAAEHWPGVGTFWDGAAADGELVTEVERAAPADDLSGEPLLEHIEALERVEAHALGLKFRTVAAFVRDYRVRCAARGGPVVSDPKVLASATCELAFLLRMTPGATETLVGKAMRLAESLPATLDAVEGGAISRQSVDVILLETAAMEAGPARGRGQALPGGLRALTAADPCPDHRDHRRPRSRACP